MLYMKASTPGDNEGGEGEAPPQKELVVQAKSMGPLHHSLVKSYEF